MLMNDDLCGMARNVPGILMLKCYVSVTCLILMCTFLMQVAIFGVFLAQLILKGDYHASIISRVPTYIFVIPFLC